MDSATRLNRDYAISLGFLLIVAMIPLLTGSIYWLGVLVVTMYFAMLAAGWNLQIGYTGQVSLAPATFAMIGAYATGLIGQFWSLSAWFSIPAGAVVSGAIGMALGATVLRLRGPYLALTTLAFAEVVHSLIFNAYDITGGQNGLAVMPILESRIAYFYLFLAALLATQTGLFLLLRSRAGLYLQAIRDDEIAARTRGIRTVFWKVSSFTCAAFISGAAGALYAHFARLINPDLGVMFQTGLVMTIVIIGGTGSLFGPLLGAFLIYSSTEALRDFGGFHLLLYAALVILVARFFREGIWGMVSRLRLPKSAQHVRSSVTSTNT